MNAWTHLADQTGQFALTPRAVLNVVAMTVSNGSIIQVSVKTSTNAYPRLGQPEQKAAFQNAEKN